MLAVRDAMAGGADPLACLYMLYSLCDPEDEPRIQRAIDLYERLKPFTDGVTPFSIDSYSALAETNLEILDPPIFVVSLVRLHFFGEADRALELLERCCRAWPREADLLRAGFQDCLANLKRCTECLAEARRRLDAGDIQAEPGTPPVWQYWEGPKPPWIEACHATVRAHAADVRLLGPEEFDALRGDADRDIDLSALHVCHRSDYIRAFLLAKYGGLWIDSDAIVMQDLTPTLMEPDKSVRLHRVPTIQMVSKCSHGGPCRFRGG